MRMRVCLLSATLLSANYCILTRLYPGLCFKYYSTSNHFLRKPLPSNMSVSMSKCSSLNIWGEQRWCQPKVKNETHFLTWAHMLDNSTDSNLFTLNHSENLNYNLNFYLRKCKLKIMGTFRAHRQVQNLRTKPTLFDSKADSLSKTFLYSLSLAHTNLFIYPNCLRVPIVGRTQQWIWAWLCLLRSSQNYRVGRQ